MRRIFLQLSYIGFLLLLVTSCQAQAVSRCRPSQPLPAKPPPGIVGLSLSRDGKMLVSAGAGGNIRFWNVKTGQMERTLTGHTNALYKAVYSPNEKLIASSSRDTTVRIWDVASGRELHKLTGYKCSVKSVAFSPNGKTLASVGNDGMLKIWDAKTGKEIKSLVHTNSPDVDGSNYSVVFSRDGKRIYAGNGDGTISEWDAATGKETKIWKAHSDLVFSLTFSPDYRRLASGGYNPVIKLWDTANWREIRTFEEKKTDGLYEQMKPVAFSPNGKLIAASVAGFNEKQRQYVYIRTYIWNVETGEKLFTLEGHKFDVDSIVFTPDNRFVVTGGIDGNIKFWDLKTGQEARTFTMQRVEKTND